MNGMGFIERELERIQVALREPHYSEEVRSRLYVAQQALAWALEPGGFKYPYDMIMGKEAETASYRLPLSPIPIVESISETQ